MLYQCYITVWLFFLLVHIFLSRKGSGDTFKLGFPAHDGCFCTWMQNSIYVSFNNFSLECVTESTDKFIP
jgi:hypothetical protein